LSGRNASLFGVEVYNGLPVYVDINYYGNCDGKKYGRYNVERGWVGEVRFLSEIWIDLDIKEQV